jgi:SsrA-binding protein
VAKGKQQHDKRNDVKDREWKLDKARIMKKRRALKNVMHPYPEKVRVFFQNFPCLCYLPESQQLIPTL